MKNKYEVFLRDKRTGNRRTLMVEAYTFADAETEVLLYYDPGNEEIIRIEKEYEPYVKA